MWRCVYFILEFLLSRNKSIPGCQRLHQAVVDGGLSTRGSVCGASPNVMDPRPQNLDPGSHMDEIREDLNENKYF